MTVWCWMTLLLGLLFALAALPATDGGARLFYDAVDWPIDGAVIFDPQMRFTLGVLGAVMMGWALTIFGMVKAADILGAPVWRALTGAMVAWYVLDSAISVFTGFPINAVSNTVFLATYLLPVLATRAMARPAGLPGLATA
ncbi:MAG: hypothetical protein SGJ21_02935 [Alphaproteobacteria bacterium]|nr:hypothetical protein [Alphaproteobacteria bacterium]